MCVNLCKLNKNIWVDRDPNITAFLSTIKGAKIFLSLDLSSAYHQISLHPLSHPLTSFVTPEGAFRYKRTPFGLASESVVFQRTIHRLFHKVKSVTYFQDDILIFGRSKEEHDTTLKHVLLILRDSGLTISWDKCNIGTSGVEYLGHYLDEQGVSPKMKLITATEDAPAPVSTDQLRSFLGLAEYYSRFVPMFSVKTLHMRK